MSNAASRAAQMEAVYEFFGGVASQLSSASGAGAASIETTGSFSAGDAIEVDVLGDPSEVNVVTAVSGTGPYSVSLQTPLAYAHAQGSIVSTFRSPCSITGITTVLRGEPFEIADEILPVLVVTVPDSTEYRSGGTSKIRGLPQFKGIDFKIRLMVGALLSGAKSKDQGAQLLTSFYDTLDRIGNHIRGSDLQNPSDAKILLTPNFPQGASFRFGEDFTIREVHERQENTLKIVAQIETVSTELVNA